MDGSFWDRFKLPIALSLVGVVLIIGGIFASGLNRQKPIHPSDGGKDYPKESLVQTQKTISVDVSGAVSKPGVYRLNEGSRIEDAITAAGGFSNTANQEYISKYLNLAQKLVDGSKVYVPVEGESFSGSSSASAGQTGVAGVQNKVNINTASQSELEALSGIGPVTASKIISDRPYQSVDELVSKKVMSKAIFEKIKDMVVTY